MVSRQGEGILVADECAGVVMGLLLVWLVGAGLKPAPTLFPLALGSNTGRSVAFSQCGERGLWWWMGVLGW